MARCSLRLRVSANYTVGKPIDQVSYLTDTCSSNVINPYNAGAYRAVSDFNIPHRFVLNYLGSCLLPRTTLCCSRWVGRWQTTGILNWQSGFPLSMLSGEDDSSGSCWQRPGGSDRKTVADQ